MKNVILKFVKFGMDFNYENRGGDGEKVISFETNIEVVTQNGKIYFKYNADQLILDYTDENFKFITNRVEQALIMETT